MQNFPVCGRVPGSGKNIHPSRFKYYFDLNANWIKQKSIWILLVIIVDKRDMCSMHKTSCHLNNFITTLSFFSS